MSLIKKNFLYNTLLSVSKILFPLITFPYATRVLGPDGLGLVNFVDNYTQYFVVFVALGIPVYGIRETAKISNDPKALNNLTSDLLAINFINTCLGAVIYLLIPILTGKFAENSHLYYLGLAYLFINIFTVEWFFQGKSEFKYITVRALVIRVFAILALFLFVHSREDVVYYYAITVVSFLLNAIVNYWKMLKEITFNFSFSRLRKHMKPLMYLFLANVAISLYILLDSVILGYVTDETEVGYYTAALRIVKIFLAIIGSLAIIMIPQISQLYKEGDHVKVQTLLSKSFRFIVSFGMPIVIGLMLLSKEIILLLAGQEYVPAIMTIMILSPLVLFIGLSNLFGMQVLTPTNNEKYLLVSVVTGSVISVSLNIILARFFLHNGTAIATLLAEGSVMLFSGIFASRQYKMNLDYSVVWKTVLACLPFLLFYKIATLFLTSNAWIIGFTVVPSAIYYAGLQIFVMKDDLWRAGIDILINKKFKK
ncbi:flippase [Chitinophaga parva]|uniref:flippase n=1 Tax=Chitinophaga parva TaxID=2169414 RepID=UPI001401E468|nr:flippase [Chitinophaga parva]